jgi:hypothetical protein
MILMPWLGFSLCRLLFNPSKVIEQWDSGFSFLSFSPFWSMSWEAVEMRLLSF